MSENEEKNTEMKPKRHEIIIGLVGAVGVDFESITKTLKEKLKSIGYKTKYIKLSDQIKEYNPYLPPLKRVAIKEKPENERIENLMNAGDNIREFSERGDAVGLLALIKLFEMRKKDEGPNFNTACILKSLKHPEEVYTLRRIYGPGFFLIGIHSSREKRKKKLSTDIARSLSNSRKQREYYSVSEKLMNRDEKGTKKLGQQVSDTFHLSDVFVSLDDEKRDRDFERGSDSNKEEINNMIEGIESKLKEAFGEKVRNADLRKILRNTDIKNITEFGRSVHAEMDALTQAARLGVSIKNASLYTTLFPCHNCTKHIIASGIKRVVYIEPYLKSLATQLHEDAITVDEPEVGKVRFEPFIGVHNPELSDHRFRF